MWYRKKRIKEQTITKSNGNMLYKKFNEKGICIFMKEEAYNDIVTNEVINNEQGLTIEEVYTVLRRKTKEVDFVRRKKYFYDDNQNLVKREDYDENGACIQEMNFKYNEKDLPIKAVVIDKKTLKVSEETYTYDEFGELKTMVDYKGVISEFNNVYFE